MEELSPMIVSSPFYEKNEVILNFITPNGILGQIFDFNWSCVIVPCYSTKFGLYFMQLESKMRILKIWIPSVGSFTLKMNS